MKAQINIPPFFQHLVDGLGVADVDGSTVGECLDDLVKQFPQLQTWLFGKNGKLLKYLEVYINGESSYPDELTRRVNDGDELHIVNIIAGG